MALNLAELAPQPGAGMTPRRASRTSGPNPFLDNGWLEESYTNGQDYEVGPVSGWYEEGVIQRGERAGEPTTRLAGDAATVVSMLRTAANKLGIGVTIEVVPAKRGKNMVIVKYMGKTRKNYTRGTDEDTEE
jgi:hypothetical protein